MTIEEALEKVHETASCWIVWNSANGEILSVTGIGSGASPAERMHPLGALGNFGVPVRSRFFNSGDVTQQVLEQVRSDIERVRTRVTVLNGWSQASVDELVQVLERGVFLPPMDKDLDSRIIVDHLWELHRTELSDDTQQRLRALVQTAVLSESASRNLDVYLCTLKGNERALRAIWRRQRTVPGSYESASVVLECVAHLGMGDPEIIDSLIDRVEQPGMFGPRHEAMMLLGKLGAKLGRRAAIAIRECIYESSPQVAAERRRVLQRIESSDTDWERCQGCCYGRIHSADSHGARPCPDCLGLGYLPGTDAMKGT